MSGSCNDGPKDKENIVDAYVPLLKLYDCNEAQLDAIKRRKMTRIAATTEK